MNLYRHSNRLILGFILLSLLLHLFLLLIPKTSLFRPPVSTEPVYVEVRRPAPSPEQPRELDVPVRKELEKPRETPAKRLGPADQVVKEETAPPGKDDMDRARQSRASKPLPAAAPQPEAVAKKAPQETSVSRNETESPAPKATPQGDQPPPAAPPSSKPLPDLESLTRISPQVLASIESDWRRKYREDTRQGDTVWLDTENDLLNSFMRRFRDNIYLVWDYPAEALHQLQSGTCLLRITITRQGDVEEVKLLESSGYPLLDREAIDSVKQGATYGPLPRAYPHEKLNIMAFFQYNISNVTQTSRRSRRPGWIY